MNAPASLTIYVLIHLVNSNFLGLLYSTVQSPATFFMRHKVACLLKLWNVSALRS